MTHFLIKQTQYSTSSTAHWFEAAEFDDILGARQSEPPLVKMVQCNTLYVMGNSNHSYRTCSGAVDVPARNVIFIDFP